MNEREYEEELKRRAAEIQRLRSNLENQIFNEERFDETLDKLNVKIQRLNEIRISYAKDNGLAEEPHDTGSEPTDVDEKVTETDVERLVWDDTDIETDKKPSSEATPDKGRDSKDEEKPKEETHKKDDEIEKEKKELEEKEKRLKEKLELKAKIDQLLEEIRVLQEEIKDLKSQLAKETDPEKRKELENQIAQKEGLLDSKRTEWKELSTKYKEFLEHIDELGKETSKEEEEREYIKPRRETLDEVRTSGPYGGTYIPYVGGAPYGGGYLGGYGPGTIRGEVPVSLSSERIRVETPTRELEALSREALPTVKKSLWDRLKKRFGNKTEGDERSEEVLIEKDLWEDEITQRLTYPLSKINYFEDTFDHTVVRDGKMLYVRTPLEKIDISRKAIKEKIEQIRRKIIGPDITEEEIVERVKDFLPDDATDKEFDKAVKLLSSSPESLLRFKLKEGRTCLMCALMDIEESGNGAEYLDLLSRASRLEKRLNTKSSLSFVSKILNESEVKNKVWREKKDKTEEIPVESEPTPELEPEPGLVSEPEATVEEKHVDSETRAEIPAEAETFAEVETYIEDKAIVSGEKIEEIAESISGFEGIPVPDIQPILGEEEHNGYIEPVIEPSPIPEPSSEAGTDAGSGTYKERKLTAEEQERVDNFREDLTQRRNNILRLADNDNDKLRYTVQLMKKINEYDGFIQRTEEGSGRKVVESIRILYRNYEKIIREDPIFQEFEQKAKEEIEAKKPTKRRSAVVAVDESLAQQHREKMEDSINASKPHDSGSSR